MSDYGELDRANRRLADENERLRVALREILKHGKTHERPCYAIHNGDCADVFQEIARAALGEREAA